MQEIRDAIMAGDTPAEEFANIELPESYRAITLHKEDEQMFAGMASSEKDPRKALHLDDVELPELGPGEALVQHDVGGVLGLVAVGDEGALRFPSFDGVEVVAEGFPLTREDGREAHLDGGARRVAGGAA